MSGVEHTGLCCHGWMQTQSSCCLGPASDVAKHPGTFVVIAWKQCAGNALLKPLPKEDPSSAKCFAVPKWHKVMEFAVRRHHCGQVKPGVKLLRPSCSSSHLCELGKWCAALVALWWWGDTAPVQCAGDDFAASASSASSTGRRARPGGEGDDMGWSPVTALDLLTANKVAAWRDQAGMQDDGDFAFRWSSYEQAVADAGHSVALAWLQVRAEQNKLLWPAAEQMVESLPKPVPSVSPKLQEPIKRKAQWGLKRKGARLRQNTAESPEAIHSRVQALSRVFMQLGAIRPRGDMSTRLHQEWQDSIMRLSQHLVTQAEIPTVLNALKTAQELLVFSKARDRRSQELDRVDLDAFLNGRQGTQAPSRALASLKWLNNQGQFGWPVQDLYLATPAKPRKKRGQALVITPPMLMFLEEQAEAMWAAGDDHWMCLLANWLIATGCLRYRHLLRSEPRRISLSTFHGFCGKGKQRKQRAGFFFAVPGHFASGWPWSKHWLASFSKLGETQRKECGLIFDGKGVPMAMSEVNKQAQICFRDHLQDPLALSTYSFRRWAPTLGQLLKLSPVEMNALGDWQNKGETPREAAMPLHYSGAKYTESVRMKHLLLNSLRTICDFEAWEVIPASELLEAARVGREALDRAIQRDSQTVWTVPLSQQAVQDQLKVSKGLLKKARELKSKHAQSSAVRAMPSSLQGKVLSAYMKNGTALCGGYQVLKCSLDESACQGAHKCAILLKQARVCGGRHPACECRDRRAMLVEQMPVPEAQEAAPPPLRPSAPIAAPRREGKQPKSPAQSPSLPARLPLEREEGPPSRGKRRRESDEEDDKRERHFDRLAINRGRTAEAPTRIFQHSWGGELWLSGLQWWILCSTFRRYRCRSSVSLKSSQRKVASNSRIVSWKQWLSRMASCGIVSGGLHGRS